MPGSGPIFDPTATLADGILGVSGPLVLPPGAQAPEAQIFVTVVQESTGASVTGVGTALANLRWRAELDGSGFANGTANGHATLVVPGLPDLSGTWSFNWSAEVTIEGGTGPPVLRTALVPRYGAGGQHGDVTPSPPRAVVEGPYSRMFGCLPPFAPDTSAVRDALAQLAATMNANDSWTAAGGCSPAPTASTDAGWAFFGQFIDHDITFDPGSSLQRSSSPDETRNYRTPVLELDSLYGSGPSVSSHLYDPTPPSDGFRFLLDDNQLPRNSARTALLGDPRNDSNPIIAGIHRSFLLLHNQAYDQSVTDGFTPGADAFLEAQRRVRWQFQWSVVEEFLPTVVEAGVIAQVMNGRLAHFLWKGEPKVPVEFSVAAYRYGHSEILPGYQLNGTLAAGTDDLLKPALRGATVDWPRLFGPHAQHNRRIDTKITTPLFTLPFSAPFPDSQGVDSLALRNLLRHLTFGIPSGENVARALDLQPIDTGLRAPLTGRTPLWYYALLEAERIGTGKLGEVGGRIVAEILIGLLMGDPDSYLSQQAGWRTNVTLAQILQ